MLSRRSALRGDGRRIDESCRRSVMGVGRKHVVNPVHDPWGGLADSALPRRHEPLADAEKFGEPALGQSARAARGENPLGETSSGFGRLRSRGRLDPRDETSRAGGLDRPRSHVQTVDG